MIARLDRASFVLERKRPGLTTVLVSAEEGDPMRSARHLFVMILLLTLVGTACGDDDLGGVSSTDPLSTSGTTAPSDDGDDASTTTATTTAPDDSGPDLLCEDELTEVGLGTPVEAENSEDQPAVCFWVEVPDGLDAITFSLSGMDADLTLGVGYGFVRTVQYNVRPYWDSRESGPVDESVVLENPAPGPYFIVASLGERDGYTGFTVSVDATPVTTAAPTGGAPPSDTECRFPATELAVGDSAEGEIVWDFEDFDETAGDILPTEWYCVEASGDFTVTLTGLSASLDVRVTMPGESANWADLARTGEERFVEVDGGPGLYVIEVYSSYNEQATTYTITIG
jgi:hypothetical protein